MLLTVMVADSFRAHVARSPVAVPSAAVVMVLAVLLRTHLRLSTDYAVVAGVPGPARVLALFKAGLSTLTHACHSKPLRCGSHCATLQCTRVKQLPNHQENPV
jgi:hypothetical protein